MWAFPLLLSVALASKTCSSCGVIRIAAHTPEGTVIAGVINEAPSTGGGCAAAACIAAGHGTAVSNHRPCVGGLPDLILALTLAPTQIMTLTVFFCQHSDMADGKREATLAAFLERAAEQRSRRRRPPSPARRPAPEGAAPIDKPTLRAVRRLLCGAVRSEPGHDRHGPSMCRPSVADAVDSMTAEMHHHASSACQHVAASYCVLCRYNSHRQHAHAGLSRSASSPDIAATRQRHDADDGASPPEPSGEQSRPRLKR